MLAQILNIEAKAEAHVSAVRPSDFTVSQGETCDPSILLQNPSLSLYCLDFETHQALFVETPTDCDLTRAPFLYMAQREHAQRLIGIPFETLHQLADQVTIDPSRLILIYSIGRCGSTLLSTAFSAVEGVESLSEPDIFTQMIGTWGADDLDGENKRRLLRSCTLLQCLPGQIRGATAWALKFRSRVTEMWPLFYAAFPEAKVVFLYRHAEPWARSFHRIMGAPDPTATMPLDELRNMFGHLTQRLESLEMASPLEILTSYWLAPMEGCLAMQRNGIPAFVMRYEELSRAPKEVFSQLLTFCGLEAHTVRDLDAVLARDAQEGSQLSRESLANTTAHLAPEHLETLRRLIRENSPELAADTILPGTYLPLQSQPN